MIAVDTNIIVRLLTRDDEQQYLKSIELFRNQDIFIPDSVIVEVEWVLRFTYLFSREDICNALRSLFGLPNVQLTNASSIAQSLQWHEGGLDFADALHLAQSQNCSKLYTFDQKFIRRANNLTQCTVEQP